MPFSHLWNTRKEDSFTVTLAVVMEAPAAGAVEGKTVGCIHRLLLGSLHPLHIDCAPPTIYFKCLSMLYWHVVTNRIQNILSQ